MKPLTARQRVMLDAIREHIAKRGRPPTLRELGAVVGCGYMGARVHVTALARKGYVRRDFRAARGLALIGEPAKLLPPRSCVVEGLGAGLFFAVSEPS